MPKEIESEVVDYLQKNVAKSTSDSETMRMQKQLLLNKEWTIEDWAFLVKNFTEKELINNFFHGDKFAFQFYKDNAYDQIKMKMLVEKGLDPHHLDKEDLESFYPDNQEGKMLSATDHGITKELEQSRLGERGLDFKIDTILMNQFHGAEFTPEGLQAFAEEHGHGMTLQNAKIHADKVNKMLRRIRMMDPRRTGVVDIENEMVHELKKYAKKNGIDSATANMMVLHGKKMISIMCPNIGRNIAESVSQTNKTGRIRTFARLVKNGADFLGLELNDVISQVINDSREKSN